MSKFQGMDTSDFSYIVITQKLCYNNLVIRDVYAVQKNYERKRKKV